MKKSQKISNLFKLHQVLATKMLQTIKTAQTGHLGACCSSLELMAVLYFGDILRYDSKNPKHPGRDYVLNRGHLGPLKYSIFNMLGWLQNEEMENYRQFGSRLAGHEDMFLTPGVDISPNGSLGMLLSYAVGARIGLSDQNMDNRIFCFLGDGEEQEGNVSEAARHATHLGLKNLICIIDKNNGQLSTRPNKIDSKSDLASIWKGYGWQVVEINDGHNMQEILQAYKTASSLAEYGPVVIIANTIKGNGIPGAEKDFCGYHVMHGSEIGETIRPIDIDSVLDLLLSDGLIDYSIPVKILPTIKMEDGIPFQSKTIDWGLIQKKEIDFCYEIEDRLLRYLDEILGDMLYVVTADYPIRSLTYFSDEFPLRKCHYLNVGIREQHMTAMIHGIMCVRPNAKCIVMCGDAFMYRHADQINVLAQAETSVMFLAVQSGLSGAKNGSTHQSSGQSGMFLNMPGVNVFEPGDQKEFFQAFNSALWSSNGPSYIRLHKEPLVLSLGRTDSNFGYTLATEWYKTPDVTIVTSGMLVKQADQAKQTLLQYGINCNVVSICSLSNCLLEGCDLGLYLPSDVPLLIYYNGNSEILSSVVFKNLIKAKKIPSIFKQKGFNIGKTGSVPELMSYFGLNTHSMVEDCLQVVPVPVS